MLESRHRLCGDRAIITLGALAQVIRKQAARSGNSPCPDSCHWNGRCTQKAAVRPKRASRPKLTFEHRPELGGNVPLIGRLTVHRG